MVKKASRRKVNFGVRIEIEELKKFRKLAKLEGKPTDLMRSYIRDYIAVHSPESIQNLEAKAKIIHKKLRSKNL